MFKSVVLLHQTIGFSNSPFKYLALYSAKHTKAKKYEIQNMLLLQQQQGARALLQLAGCRAHREASHPLHPGDEEVHPLTSCKADTRVRLQHQLLNCGTQGGDLDNLCCCCSWSSELTRSPLQVAWAGCVTIHHLGTLRIGQPELGAEAGKHTEGWPLQSAAAAGHHPQQ